MRVVRGQVGGSTASTLIRLGADEAVALDLSQAQIASYARQGGNLVITLVDGREIVVAGFFEAPVGLENELHLLNGDGASRVHLTEGGSGVLQPRYGASEGRFSALDGLAAEGRRSGRDGPVPAGAGRQGSVGPVCWRLECGCGRGGGAFGGSGGRGGSGGGGWRSGQGDASTMRAATTTLTMATADPQIAITGRGEPGDTGDGDPGQRDRRRRPSRRRAPGP